MSNFAIRFSDVNIVFGRKPSSALPYMDAGEDRGLVQRHSGQILGVHNCSLDVRSGEILVLMGLSGSGKSTLLRAVNGLNPVVRGEVFVRADSSDGVSHDINVTRADSRGLSILRTQLTAMVFQQFALLPWRTVLGNVALGLELSGVGVKEREERAMEQLDLVQLSDWSGSYPHELSGGMQQRVGLARAFATRAPILLMDEPFSALDPLIRNKLQDELLLLQEKLRRTIIFVSHDLDEAVKLGNEIAVMEGGRIIQSGSSEDILLSPADDYVSEFVAHLNPMNVLCAELIMGSVKKFKLPSDAVGDDGILRRGDDIYVSKLLGFRSVIRLMRDIVSVGRGVLYVYDSGDVVGKVEVGDILNSLSR